MVNLDNWTEVLSHFARYQRAAALSERTIEAREQVLLMLARHSGQTPRRLETEDLLDFLNRPNARTGESLSPGTKQVERSYLQTWSRWMIEEGFMFHDPARRLPRVRVPRRAPRPLAEHKITEMQELNL